LEEVMPLTATAFARSAARSRVGPLRDVLRMLLLSLDRLVPPQGSRQKTDLPPEWFKYPPI
jgi:hypothetical protein